MPKAMTDNLAGHRAKYNHLINHVPGSDVGQLYVGGSNSVLTGFHELEAVRSYASLDRASVVDIGCGIGRLTQHMLHENLVSYLGTDIVPEILEYARIVAKDDDRFSFSIANECKIPAGDKTVSIVTAFSVITHMVDEEVFEYICEAKRVLNDKGIAIFSFLDFMNPVHQP